MRSTFPFILTYLDEVMRRGVAFARRYGYFDILSYSLSFTNTQFVKDAVSDGLLATFIAISPDEKRGEKRRGNRASACVHNSIYFWPNIYLKDEI